MMRQVPDGIRTPARSGELAVSMQDGFEIAVFVGWAFCICSLISVARHSSSEFRSIDRSRGRWFWINALGVVPYLGIVTALTYFFSVSVRFPEKPRTIHQPKPGSTGRPQRPAGQGTQRYQASAPRPLPKPNCTRCGGSGRMSDTFCNGSGRQLVNGEDVPHFTCSGSGIVQCSSCRGSGKQG
jgi:hypothetical protein